MKFRLEIECDNAAFGDDGLEYEVEWIMTRQILPALKTGLRSGYAFDSNGNRVGSFELTE